MSGFFKKRKPATLFLYALFYLFVYFFLIEIKDAYVKVGLASWYGGRDHGDKTASGEIYDENKFTAAHRRLRFGTKVKVTRLSDGRSTTVSINDRGPYIPGRIIDLSKRAAQDLGMVKRGVAKVRIEILP